MPIDFEIPPQQNHSIARWRGVVSDREMLESYKAFYRSKRWQPGQHEIVDQREADMSQITTSALQRMADFVQKHFTRHNVRHARTAVVCGTGLHFGISRIYEAWASDSPEETKLFFSMEEAEAWVRSEPKA